MEIENLKTSVENNTPSSEDTQKVLDTFNSLKTDLGVNSIDEVGDLMMELMGMKSKLSGVDVDTLLDKANGYEKSISFMAEQEERNKRANESLEETISRLTQEIQDLKSGKPRERNDQSGDDSEAKALLDAFNTTVGSVVENSSIPENHRKFVSTFLGIDNPALSVDINNQYDVRRMARQGIEQYNQFVSAIIEDYRAGKLKLPNMDKVDQTAGAVDNEAKISNLKQARAALTERLGKSLFRGGQS